MKISLIGNCQIKGLAWYLQRINSHFDVQYIWTDIGMGCWAKSQYCPFVPRRGRDDRHVPTIENAIQAQARLLDSDYIIYQPIRPSRIQDFNYEDIQKYGGNAKLTSVGCFAKLISVGCFYCVNTYTTALTDNKEYEERTGLLGMKERAEKFNLDIQAHKIIEECGVDAIATDHAYHPKALYFLELVKRICEKTGWDYYNAEQHAKYLKEGFPFG